MLRHRIPRRGLAVAAAATLLPLALSAAEGRWTQGFGQGNLEYFIDAQGVRLYIHCPTENGSADVASSVSLTGPDGREVTKFELRVGGNVYAGPFDADSRAGANNFTSLLGDLRRSDAVVSFGGKKVTFPKSNVAQVVPVFGSRNFSCNVL